MTQAPARQKVFRMNLAQFDRYLRDKSSENDACVKQLDKIHGRFQAVFQRELEIWQELYAYCYPEVATRREEMPVAFQRYLDQIEAEELARIQGEIAELETQIEEHREAMDRRTAQAQAAVQALKKANPGLNRQEETLKARIVELQDQYAQIYEQLEELQAPSMGWLTNAAQISRLKRQQRKTKREQEETVEALRRVRHDWLTRVQETSEKQSELREAWQQAGINSAELQARYDHLVNNLEDLARQDGLQRSLLELTDDPGVEGELGAKLSELCEHNSIRMRYEQGLAASSETLGLVRGIGTGLKRFSSSVRDVLAQQRRYNLKQIRILVPHDVGVINQTWEHLRERISDEEQMGRDPLLFVSIAQEYVIDRLTEPVIQQFFEQMGDALNRGTAAWG